MIKNGKINKVTPVIYATLAGYNNCKEVLYKEERRCNASALLPFVIQSVRQMGGAQHQELREHVCKN